MLVNINYNTEGFYCMLINKTYGDNPPKVQTEEYRKIVKLIVKVFLGNPRKNRVGAETAYGASDPHIGVGQYLCHTIQVHRVMTEFQEENFHRHTSIFPSVVNNLFNHGA